MKTLGQVAYEIYQDLVDDCSITWRYLDEDRKEAWEEVAVCMRNAKHFMSPAERKRVVEEVTESFKGSGGGTG